MSRLVIAVLTVLGAFMVLALPAQAQYVPGQPGIIIDPGTLPDTGGSATIRGFGCPRNSKVDAFITVNGTDVFLGTTTADDNSEGSFTIPVTIPPLPAGEYTVLVTCGSLKLSTVLTITPTATAATGTLPATGSDATMLLRIGVALIAVGGFVLLGVRKRRRLA